MTHVAGPVDQGAYVVPARPAGPLPLGPVEYHQLLRGPRYRWWRPVLSLLLGLAFAVVGVVAITGGGYVISLLQLPGLGSYDDDLSPLNMLATDLSLAVLIPVAGLSIWIVHRIRPRFVSSVVGGIRWRWLARCVLVIVPVWVVYMVVGTLVDPPESGRPGGWVLLLVMAVAITPFQAAGEEYLFRGWLVQNLGSLFSRRLVGLVVSTVMSAALFSLAHGSLDPWVILEISTLAVAACLTNWRTGGLEAGIAMHLVNNVSIGIVTTTIGGYADSFVSEDTTGTPVEFILGVVVHVIAVALILWQSRRSQVRRRFQPAAALEPAEPGYVLADDRPIWTAPLG